MKKYLGLFILLCGGAYVTSCDDSLLDPYTPGALTEEVAIQTSSDLQTLMNTVYGTMINAAVSEIEFNSTFSDESAVGFANGGQGLDENLSFIMNSATASPGNIWAGHYFTLAYANRVIKFSENIEPVDAADQETINRLVAEALTIRAYCHVQLITYFSTNPKDAAALGVILSNDVYPTSFTGTRATNGEIYAQIDADLQQATALYATVPAAANPIYANKNFTNAVKARAAALRGDYTNALTYANDVIAGAGLNLATFTNNTAGYLSVFLTDTNAATNEVIFKLKNTETSVGGIWASVNTTVNGSPFFEVGRGLFNDLNTTMHPSATPVTVTGFTAPSTLIVPGNTLQVNDMISFTEARPTNATTTNGVQTQPGNALLKGKVYFVKSVSGDNITLTDAPFSTTTINISGINPASNPFTPVVAMTNAGDIRYSTIVHPSSIINADYMTVVDFQNTDKLAFRKYPGTSANGLFINDIKIARLSEMYLIRAEALIAAGDLTGAAAAIKAIRDARFNKPQPLPSYGSAMDAWKDVLYERKKEFAAEGYRFIDIKRLGALAGEQITRDPRDCELSNNACSLPITDHRFALPIPEVESNPNPGILSQQNPGY